MADRKVTQLDTLASAAPEDYLLIIDSPNGTPVSKKIRISALAGALPNTTIQGTLDVSSNTTISGTKVTVSANATFSGNSVFATNEIVITTSQTPANSTITVTKGTMFWDNNYLYVAVSNNVLKRATLASF